MLFAAVTADSSKCRELPKVLHLIALSLIHYLISLSLDVLI
jgi:hypothetical protein